MQFVINQFYIDIEQTFLVLFFELNFLLFWHVLNNAWISGWCMLSFGLYSTFLFLFGLDIASKGVQFVINQFYNIDVDLEQTFLVWFLLLLRRICHTMQMFNIAWNSRWCISSFALFDILLFYFYWDYKMTYKLRST